MVSNRRTELVCEPYFDGVGIIWTGGDTSKQMWSVYAQVLWWSTIVAVSRWRTTLTGFEPKNEVS